MKKLAVFFGGRSSEHDVSIITGTQLIENADKSKYEIIPVYIAGDGAWYSGEALKSVAFYKKPTLRGRVCIRCFFCPSRQRVYCWRRRAAV